MLISLALALPVQAEVKQAQADSMLLEFNARIAAPPAAAFDSMVHIERWWSSEHTYSGSASNMSLSAEPGGCFCERWKDGAVEHGRVVFVQRDQLLRLVAPLGPLQARALSAVLTFQLTPAEGGTVLAVSYRVNGSSASALDKSAPAVDGVLSEAVQRLKRLIETGKPAG
jgi:uncharacterized protein YndB with AHSA1/START domain